MFIYKWIEGEDNLNSYCQKRFNELPRFVETIGSVWPSAKVYLVYKLREDKQKYTPMFLLFMQHQKGTVGYIQDIKHQSYEQIRTDRSAILIR